MTRRRRDARGAQQGSGVDATESSLKHQSPSSEGSGAQGRCKLAPGLYLTATPIGNMADLSLRAIEVLGAADVIACEDTRVTGKLLARHRITTPRLSYHEHNAARVRPQLLRRLSAGQAVALVSDAGTPLISDPGYKLVRATIEAGLPVTAVPGPSAVLAALTLSGLPTDRFLFAGFLASRGARRRRELKDLAAIEATLVVLESARRLPATLADMAAALGDRPAAVARELTKRFEEVRRAPLPELARHYAAEGAPKGEVVIVVAPPGPRTVDEAAAEAMLREALRTMGTREAAAQVAAASGIPRRRLYGRALELRKGG
ncbi:MAG: 16S rRNA (cytidine(1402)-2'-O)-methyltransferase [Alphaproteobacteria bacterium]|nr:16S rRNA (cytidine(1402)-2'-O)-methyltransferase [Alphaproteobacteria bacterium]